MNLLSLDRQNKKDLRDKPIFCAYVEWCIGIRCIFNHVICIKMIWCHLEHIQEQNKMSQNIKQKKKKSILDSR